MKKEKFNRDRNHLKKIPDNSGAVKKNDMKIQQKKGPTFQKKMQESINSRVDQVEERICELEERDFDFIQTENQEKKNKKE